MTHKKQRQNKNSNPRTITGIISVSAGGKGFVATPDSKEDIIIFPENLNTALNGDTVKIAVKSEKEQTHQSFWRNPRVRKTGTVISIEKRARDTFVGVLEKATTKFQVITDDKRFYTKISIPKPPQGAESGQKVQVRIYHWANPKELPEGEIIETIGLHGEHNTEMRAIVLEKGFEIKFKPEIENEAKKIKTSESPIPKEEISKRRDFRKILTMTIDPVDAKDFDDAISFRELPNSKFEIGIHIADVSHYVRENTKLNDEARKRGFSVYLVDRTIPMLPEILSNDLCSLNPNEEKLAFSAVFEMDSHGKISSRWFGKTIIKSAKRFSYEEAQKSLDDKNGIYHKELSALNNIAKEMRAEKVKKGAIDFEQEEVKFELDALGRPTRIYKKERLDTHKLVEEYMLLANREVACHMFSAFEKKGIKGPFIYRTHDVPNKEKISELAVFIKALGYELPLKKGSVSAKDMQALFNEISGKAEEGIIKTAALRSMAKAIYTTENIGHFGLAFEYYTHFTSPIRRYADLLVHRILWKELSGISFGKDEWIKYEKMAEENTQREISASDAERASRKYKQVEYMSSHIGEIFDGIITGVTEWGIYVEETATKCEGMIRIRDLGKDFFVLDQKNYCLVGEKTGQKFSLGDKVKFRVVSADIERKTLDFSLV